MKKLIAVIVTAVICLLPTGCSLSLNSPDILTPPKAQGDQAEIQELIRKNAEGSYEMVYPEDGKFNSSVIFRDLDDDDDEEAVAMYTCGNDAIRILIADRSGSDYTMLSEHTVYTPKLSQVEFADFGGDGLIDIILSYPASPSPLQSLTILTVGDEVIQSDMISACAAHLVGDYDGDGKDDLLTLALSDGENLPTARLLTGEGSGLTEQSSCEIASDIKAYVSLSFGKINDDLSGAIVDAVDDNSQYATQLICYDYNARGITNPLYVNNSYVKTKRAAAILSADVNGDGVTEVPVCRTMDYSQNEESSSVCDRIDWSCYDYSQLNLTTRKSAVLCDRLGFLLNLGAEHADIVTARYTGENSMSVYLWEYRRSTPERTDKLLTVKRYLKENFDESTVLEAVAGESGEYIYTYIIEPGQDAYAFSDDEVTKNFVLLTNQPEN